MKQNFPEPTEGMSTLLKGLLFVSFLFLSFIPPAYAQTTTTQTDLSVEIKYGLEEQAERYPDQRMTFHITARNKDVPGANRVTQVEVKDLFPSGYSINSFFTHKGIYDEDTGIWNVGALGVGEHAVLVVSVSVLRTGDYLNEARISAPNVIDLDPSDNVASLGITLLDPYQPTHFVLDHPFVGQSNGVNAVVDTLFTIAREHNREFHYSFIPGEGSTHNHLFNVAKIEGYSFLRANDAASMPVGTYQVRMQ